MIEISCEACGWIAITSQPPNQVWAEHEASCPAVGGAVRYIPELPPLPNLLPEIRACKHRLVRRQIAVTAAGVKRFAVVCELCGRHVDRL
ncbi:MAG TPA: hypothetical protein VFA30_08210 [Gaiellaceae bacterium]|nr:hypothetical protein [Gaiellaceae bacterium]